MSIDTKTLEILEDLPLRADEAWYVLLVYLGLKSGLWASIESDIWRQGDTPKQIHQSTRNIIEESLKSLGLVYSIELRDTNAGLMQSDDDSRERLNQIADIFIAKDQTTLDNLILARKNNDDKLLGLSLGYPKSAVEAFGTDKKTFVSNLSPKIQLSEVGQLTYFTLSKDNWKNELAVVEKWISALKENSHIMWYKLRRFASLVDEELINLAIRSRAD